MKKLTCADVGVDCRFAAEGETSEEVINKLFAHAAEAHKEMLDNMSDEDKTVVRQKMTQLLDKQ